MVVLVANNNEGNHVLEEVLITELEGEETNQTCRWVVFRLDEIQEYWLNDVQIAVMEVFQTKLEYL